MSKLECKIQRYTDDNGETQLRMPCTIVSVRMNKDGQPAVFSHDEKYINEETGQPTVYFKAVVEWITGRKDAEDNYVAKKSSVIAYLGQTPSEYSPRLDSLIDAINPIDGEPKKEFLLQADQDAEGTFYLRLSHLEWTDGAVTADDFGDFLNDTADATPAISKTNTKEVTA